MQTALIGLGRMGKNVTLHFLERGVGVVAYNRSRNDIDEVVSKGAIGAYTLADIPQKITGQIVVLLFIPAGSPIDEVLFGVRGKGAQPERDQPREIVEKGLADILPKGAIVVDGGNSFYKDSQRRYLELKKKGLNFLDMGTSGGVDGARNGACLMVGGDEAVYSQVEPLLAKIANKDGYGYFGPSGAGHFVKMVHNAVEYGMMGAIAEGFELVRSSKIEDQSNPTRPPLSQRGGEEEFKIDLAKLAKVWAHGSIVSGLLMDKTAAAFAKDPQLSEVVGEVPRGETEGEIEWLESTGVAQPVIQAARRERVETRTKPSFIGKVIAALRREFGGHAVKES